MAAVTLPMVVLDLQGDPTRWHLPPDTETRLHVIAVATLAHLGLAGWYEISLVLTGEHEMQRINRQHRGIDRPTDVLSFPLSETPLLALPNDVAWTEHAFGDDTHDTPLPDDLGPQDDAPPPDVRKSADDPHISHAQTRNAPITYGNAETPLHLGDIMIAVSVVEHQATAAGHSVWWELCFLVAHGVLHLVGYDDYYERGYQAMVAHQEAVLGNLAIFR